MYHNFFLVVPYPRVGGWILQQIKFRKRFCPCRSRLSIIFCWSFGVLLHVLFHATSLSKSKLQSCWQELRIQQRHQILSTKVFCGETSIRLRGQPQLRCVSVSVFFFILFFFSHTFRKSFLFFRFSSFSSFFYFFLTGKNLISCELSCKKKIIIIIIKIHKNIKNEVSFFLYKVPKKLRYLFYHSVLSGREFRHYKILLDYVYGFLCDVVTTFLLLLCNVSFLRLKFRRFCRHQWS